MENALIDIKLDYLDEFSTKTKKKSDPYHLSTVYINELTILYAFVLCKKVKKMQEGSSLHKLTTSSIYFVNCFNIWQYYANASLCTISQQ